MMSIETPKFSGFGDAKRQSPLGGDNQLEKLDKLFSVLDPNTSKSQVPPLRYRKLPPSLFKQAGSNKPMSPKKLRAPLNSPDALPTNGAMPTLNPAISGILVAHSRTKSSPAFLQLNHSATNPNLSHGVVHTAPLAVCVPPSKQPCLQQSALSNSFTMPDLIQSSQPLAGAGSMQNSTLSSNNNNCASMCSLSTSNSAQFRPSNSFDAATLGEGLVSNGAPCVPVDTGVSLGPLPSGWESAVTPEGRVFFIEYVFPLICSPL